MKPEPRICTRVCRWVFGLLWLGGALCAAAEEGQQGTAQAASGSESTAAIHTEGGQAPESDQTKGPVPKTEADGKIAEETGAPEKQTSGKTTGEKPAAQEKMEQEPSKEVLANPDAVQAAEAGTVNPWNQNRLFWQRIYHRQVTPRIFELIEYPYYRGGKTFDPEADLKAATAEESKGDAQTENKEAGSSTATEAGVVEAGENKQIPVNNENTASAAPAAEKSDENQPLNHLYEIVRLIHQWREINESESLALEVLRSVELTRTSTQIYQIKPELAIGVKRTLGSIGIANLKADKTIREILRCMAAKQEVYYNLAHLRKLLADLESSLLLLADQNDKISVALGLGTINRNNPFENAGEPIQFSYIPQDAEVNSKPVSLASEPSSR